MTGPGVDVSVVLPCLNEAGSVGDCVKRARAALDAAGVSHEVVVCDNGSTDGSDVQASSAGARVVHEARRGYGSAFMAGIAAARGDVLVLADADGTYPLEELPAFVERARAGALVLGSRFRGRILPGSMPLLHRLIGSPGTRLLLRVLFGVRCSDPHCGMRALGRATFERVRPVSTGMEFAIEMVVNAGRRGVRIDEIPITYAPRTGESKLRAVPDGWSLLRYLLLHSPTFLYLVPGLALLAGGGFGLAVLAGGDRAVGSVTFSVNTMIVSAFCALAGHQVVTLGLCARAYGIWRAGGEPLPGVLKLFTLERGLVSGLLAVAAGLVVLGRVGVRWLWSDFGALGAADHRWALVGLTIGLVGLQTCFASFLLSLVLREPGGRS